MDSPLKRKLMVVALACGGFGRGAVAVAQTLGRPEALIPNGPTSRYPLLRWKGVPGAEEYKIRMFHPGDRPCGKEDRITMLPATGYYFASAPLVCHNDICEIQYTPTSDQHVATLTGVRLPEVPTYYPAYPPNPYSPMKAAPPIIIKPKDCQGNIKIAKWAVSAVHKGVAGPESNELSFYWIESPPPAPKANPNPSIEMTCVFKSGTRVAAVFYGAHWSFLSWPERKPNPSMIGKIVTVHPQPLRNCEPDAGPGLTPAGETRFRIEHITYKDGNPEATNVDGVFSK
jgi:hypothetical protein